MLKDLDVAECYDYKFILQIRNLQIFALDKKN